MSESYPILQKIRWNAEGLIPAVVQDVETREVLMLAYMNEEALRRTLQEMRAWYYSRSRQSLWRKGETSGHTQEVINIKFDCDQDAILLTVKQMGMACHENFFTCFHYAAANEQATEFKTVGQPEVRADMTLGEILEHLAGVIHARNLERPEGAYTTYLFEKGIDKILKKVGEECAESIIAAKNNDPEEIRSEVSDLLYHLLVMLEDRGVSLKNISHKLMSRQNQKHEKDYSLK